MSTLILRIAGGLLALLGLVAVVVGGWFLAALGTSGVATFTAEPGERVVFLDPDVAKFLVAENHFSDPWTTRIHLPSRLPRLGSGCPRVVVPCIPRPAAPSPSSRLSPSPCRCSALC